MLGEKIEIKTAAVLPQKIIATSLPLREKKENSVRLVNLARVAPEKNTLYALQILKHTKQQIEFDFYGPVYNQPYFEQCKQAMAELPTNVKANYKGTIESDKVLEVVSNYQFMFMPTTGENFGHIILQSLTVGVPVIISNKTRWKQLKEKNMGWDIALEKISEFAEVIDSCAIINQTDYNKMSDAAYHYAQHYINNPELIEQNRHLFI